jgi:hypothetical protein
VKNGCCDPALWKTSEGRARRDFLEQNNNQKKTMTNMANKILAILLLWLPWAAGAQSRFTLGWDVGSGAAYHSNTTAQEWGYFTTALDGEMRQASWLSWKAGLRYQTQGGRLSGYGIQGEIRYGGHQHYQSVALCLGPALNVPLGRSWEWSTALKPGAVLQVLSQELDIRYLDERSNPRLHFQPNLRLALEVDTRLRCWLDARTALEGGLLYFGSLNNLQPLVLKRQPNDALLQNVEALIAEDSWLNQSSERTRRSGTLEALGVFAGIRHRF